MKFNKVNVGKWAAQLCVIGCSNIVTVGCMHSEALNSQSVGKSPTAAVKQTPPAKTPKTKVRLKASAQRKIQPTITSTQLRRQPNTVNNVRSSTAQKKPTVVRTDPSAQGKTNADACNLQFWQGLRPEITMASLANNTQYLCFNGFALLHSGVSKTPLWVAEYLTAARIQTAQTLNRIDSFHEETRLPAAARATLNDYASYTFDRGHMAPNGDMESREQQMDSFSLANIVPQTARNNREVWRNLEEATRVLVGREKEVYVLTGPAFLKDKLQRMGRVIVPTHVFKVLYFPQKNIVSAYFAPNDVSGTVEVISLSQLESRIHINLLPTLPNAVKSKQVALPLTATLAKRFNL